MNFMINIFLTFIFVKFILVDIWVWERGGVAIVVFNRDLAGDVRLEIFPA